MGFMYGCYNLNAIRVTSNYMEGSKDCLGQMKYCGLLSGSVSYQGHSVNIIRGTLEDSLRHGSSDLLYLMMELDMFRLCGGESIRTNMMNRIIVTASDYMGIAEPRLPIYIEQLVSEWDSQREKGGSDSNESNKKLVAIYKLIEGSRRREGYGIRDIYNIYAMGPQYASTRENVIYRDLGDPPTEIEGTWEAVQERDPPELQCSMESFIYWLGEGSVRCLEDVGKIVAMRKGKMRAGTRFRGWRPVTQVSATVLGGRMRPEYAIWEYLFQHEAMNPSSGPRMACLEALFGFFNTRSEPELYLTHAVLYFIEDVDWTRSCDLVSVTDAEVEDIWTDHNVANWKPMVYPIVKEDLLVQQICLLGGKGKPRGKGKGRRKKKEEAPMMDYVGELEEEPIPM
jgi:hypothetical protein